MASRFSARRSRAGALLILCAVLLVVLMGLVACAIDLGFTMLVKTQLQATADASALAAVGYIPNETSVRQYAQEYAGLNHPNHGGTVLTNQNVVMGTWDASTRSFTPNTPAVNAVQVTVTRTQATNNPVDLTFASVIGNARSDVTATSIAVRNARDIAFVIDLSGSMNNDTEIWATNAINSLFAPAGYPTIGSQMMADVFADFNFGAYPGTTQYLGNGNVTQNEQAFYNLTRNGGYLAGSSIPSTYRILTNDSAATRKTKGFRWIIDNQLAATMPNALPAPNSSTSYNYWAEYLDYVIQPYDLTNSQASNYQNHNGIVPYNQNTYQITSADNPSSSGWSSLPNSAITQFQNRLGYQTYVQFMMDFGRTRNVTGSTKVPLSVLSSNCPLRVDTDPNSAGFGFSFPPREQPMHASRIAIMAAINKIAERNAGIAEEAKDHIAIVTFDTAAGTQVRYPLDVDGCDYQAVKASCTGLQAVADDANSTAAENGLIAARNHLNANLNPTGARPGAEKVIVFLSDGVANVKQSTNSAVDNYVSTYNQNNDPDGEWFTNGQTNYRERNAVMMQVAQMQAMGWKVYAIGIGLAADRVLMDRMARFAGSGVQDPNNPSGPPISPYAEGNPADYQLRLTDIFERIVGSAHGALVK